MHHFRFDQSPLYMHKEYLHTPLTERGGHHHVKHNCLSLYVACDHVFSREHFAVVVPNRVSERLLARRHRSQPGPGLLAVFVQ